MLSQHKIRTTAAAVSNQTSNKRRRSREREREREKLCSSCKKHMLLAPSPSVCSSPRHFSPIRKLGSVGRLSLLFFVRAVSCQPVLCSVCVLVCKYPDAGKYYKFLLRQWLTGVCQCVCACSSPPSLSPSHFWGWFKGKRSFPPPKRKKKGESAFVWISLI